MDTSKFKGTGVALVTPFSQDLTVDFKSLEKMIDHVIDGGVEYIVTMGTTGESATLDRDEKVAIMDFTIEKVKGRVPIVAGFGGNNTQAIITSIKQYHFKGIDGILSVSPYYNKPSQRGIYEHYKAISESTELPIILYNVPGRTSSNITAETTLKIAQDCKNVIGIKEASGDLEQCTAIAKGKSKDFLLISGEDPLTLPMLSFGADGVISVVANSQPKLFSDMVRAGLKGDFFEAGKLHLEAMELIPHLFSDGNPGGVKCALANQGHIDNILRLPLVPVNESTEQNIKEALGELS